MAVQRPTKGPEQARKREVGEGRASAHDQAATTATPHGTRGPPEVPAWRRVCGSSGGLVRGLMQAYPLLYYCITQRKELGGMLMRTGGRVIARLLGVGLWAI